MTKDPPGQAIATKQRRDMAPISVTIRLGCESKEAICQTKRLGAMKVTQRETWLEAFALPDKGHRRKRLVCPICQSPFEVKVYSKAAARRRKLYFAVCFTMIATCGILFGVYAGHEKGFMGYSIAAPFILFAAWQWLNAMGGRFDPGDVVSHGRGKIHRIYGDRKVTFSDS